MAPDPLLFERRVLDGLPVLGIAQEKDDTDELIIARAPDIVSGDFTVALAAYNSELSSEAYSLRVTVIPPVDLPEIPSRPSTPDPVESPVGLPVVSGDPGTAETLVLTAPSRMSDDPSVDLLGSLGSSELAEVSLATPAWRLRKTLSDTVRLSSPSFT